MILGKILATIWVAVIAVTIAGAMISSRRDVFSATTGYFVTAFTAELLTTLFVAIIVAIWWAM